MSKICPSARANKSCVQRGCALVHDVYRCRICRAPFASQSACSQHERTATHAQRATYKCEVCSISNLPQKEYMNHLQGRKHRSKLAAAETQKRVAPVEMNVPPHHVPCTLCNTFVAEGNWDSHIRGQRHSSKQPRQEQANTLIVTEGDKYGIHIEGSIIDFGIIDGKTSASKHIQVTNNGPHMVILSKIKLTATSQGNSFQVDRATHRRQLNDGTSTTVTILLPTSVRNRGVLRNSLEFYFKIPTLRRRFAITRAVTARIGSMADFEALKTTKPYVPRKRIRRDRITRYIRGVRPQALAKIRWARKLKTFEIPADLLATMSRDDMNLSEKRNVVLAEFVNGEFERSTYTQRMQLMLWIEEEKARQELSEYDMAESRLSQRGNLYALVVPGLAEKRPSVVIGDSFFVTESGASETFEGFVHHVENRVVLLQFHKKFSSRWSPGRTYDVRFDLNRLVFRRMHQAVKQPSDSRLLFPTVSCELERVTAASMGTIRPYDSKITTNEPQRRAVASIFQMRPGSIPFIIYGPPGTGKTVTMVETIRQIIARKPDARVLACAPSNSAADILIERLIEYPSALGDMKRILFRLVAPSRLPKHVSSTVLRYSRVNSHGVFESPPRDELRTFRIIVSTCSSGGVPYGVGFEPGHFTHIFIDEAAQATEPEVMIPIMTMLHPKTNVVLSGDIKQLGPIVRSSVARELGLGVSFLERLMITPVYDEVTAKGKSIVKLTKNYRSHPAILDFPNAQFYKNELEACAPKAVTDCVVGQWDSLVKKDYPIVFHGICGQDMREDPSPSYFNPDEASVVKDYVRSLVEGRLRFESRDIGVITPYRAQVLKLRQLLRPFAPDATVGSVEEFQGQERKVIIISTVRSSQDMITFDIRHTLGFVANPRRFNVAVTRAQALLVIVGDPYVLSLDPMWKEFINHVQLRGGYTGVDLDWDTSEPVDYTARLDETRRAQGLSHLESLISRTSDLELGDEDYLEDAGAFREDE